MTVNVSLKDSQQAAGATSGTIPTFCSGNTVLTHCTMAVEYIDKVSYPKSLFYWATRWSGQRCALSPVS